MKKQALLVGINNYSGIGSLNNLNFARQDAEAVSDALKAYYGFSDEEITLMTCKESGSKFPATPSAILNQLRPEMFTEPVDLFIFGFWGHGIWEGNIRYLCPTGTLENDLPRTALSVEELKQSVSELPIHDFCFIFDCCQSISNRGKSQLMPKEEMDSLKNMGRDIVLQGQQLKSDTEITFERNVAILNACCQGQIAYEWDARKHGIFTAHLLDAMTQRMETVNDWASYLARNVSQTALSLGKPLQTPFNTLEGCIDLPVTSGPLPPPPPTTPLEGKMRQAALKMMELFQISSNVFVDAKIIEWFKRQQAEAFSVYTALDNRTISDQVAFNRLVEIARNAGNWINAHRFELGGKTFVQYSWCSLVEFANENHLEDLINAFNQ